jgi:hypothetical protein
MIGTGESLPTRGLSSWTAKLRGTAQAAASAAANFQGLDGMAAKDDYIHHDHLNVPAHRQRHRIDPHSIAVGGESPTVASAPTPFPNDHLRSDQRTPTAYLQKQQMETCSQASETTSPPRIKRLTETAATLPHHVLSKQTSNIPLLSVVSDAISDATPPGAVEPTAKFSPHHLHESPRHELYYYDDSDEEDGIAVENDPIFDSLLPQDSRCRTPKAPTHTDKKTNSPKQHRFLQDLDQRLSRPLDIEQGGEETLQEHSRGQENAWRNLLPWHRSQPKRFAPTRPEPPLTRAKFQSQSTKNVDAFTTVHSTSMLDKNDIEVLGRMKLQTSSSSNPGSPIIGIVLTVCRDHPREAFIGGTLLLSATVFFYARQFSAQDNVT